MKILLIGNFAPPFEEENLHNISLLRKLQEDGHKCTVINISETPPVDASFIHAAGNLGYFFKLLRHGVNKDVIHFLTKGYLRVGLLKLMLSIFAGTLLRTKRVLTLHSEFFSILGQMRSPFGGIQTLNTSFFLADRIICTDKETYDVAKIYKKKNNFELIPSFVYIPETVDHFDTTRTEKMKDIKNIILFANLQYPSFLFHVLTGLITNKSLPDDTGVVIVLSEKPSLKVQHGLEDTSGPLKDKLIFIEHDDVESAFKTCSRANIILRPMSCDGAPYFESFSISLKQAVRSGNYVFFPAGLVIIKEGAAEALCTDSIGAMLSSNPVPAPSTGEDPYERIIKIYKA